MKNITQKSAMLAKINAYNRATVNGSYNTEDSGRAGKDFEMQVKIALGNYRFNGVARAGRIDTYKNGAKIEIKSGCGELADLNADGEIIRSALLKSDYVIYAPEYAPEYPVENQAYVINANEFIALLDECGLIRTKKSSAMLHRPEDEQYPDKMAIQSFKNSRKKTDLLYDLLEERAVSLKKWIG